MSRSPRWTERHTTSKIFNAAIEHPPRRVGAEWTFQKERTSMVRKPPHEGGGFPACTVWKSYKIRLGNLTFLVTCPPGELGARRYRRGSTPSRVMRLGRKVTLPHASS
jgi:hypothetical protein